MARGRASSTDILVISLSICLVLLFFGAIQWLIKRPYVFYGLLAAVVLLGVGAIIRVFLVRRRNLKIKEEERLAETERQRQRQEQERLRIESLLRRDAVRDEINYMSGAEFETFMADLFRQAFDGGWLRQKMVQPFCDDIHDKGRRAVVHLQTRMTPFANLSSAGERRTSRQFSHLHAPSKDPL